MSLTLRVIAVSSLVGLLAAAATYAVSSARPSAFESRVRVQFVEVERFEYRDGERDRLVGLLETPDVADRLEGAGVSDVEYAIPERQSFVDITVRARTADGAVQGATLLADTMVERDRRERLVPLQEEAAQIQTRLAQAAPRIEQLAAQLDAAVQQEAVAETSRFVRGDPESTRLGTIAAREAQRQQNDLNRERNSLVDERVELERRQRDLQAAIDLRTSSVRVVRPATRPEGPISPRSLRDASVAFLVGAALAASAVIVADSKRVPALDVGTAADVLRRRARPSTTVS